MILLICAGMVLKKYVNEPVLTVNGLSTEAVLPEFVAKLRAVSASCQEKEQTVELMTKSGICCILLAKFVWGSRRENSNTACALRAIFCLRRSRPRHQNISWKSTELAPGLFMLESQGGFAGGNLGLITGDDGVVLIDDGLEPLVAVTVAAIEALTGDPVNFVINTHAHGDHTGANEVLHGKGATVVAHDNLRRQMVKDGSNRGALPELTFTDAVTFHLNGHTINVFHVANAHTDGDAVIHFPEVNIIHAGRRDV